MYITFFAKKSILLYNKKMLRRSLLSGSWYPDDEVELKDILQEWTRDIDPDSSLFAAVVPHAGWYYSGQTAAKTLKKLCADRELIVVIGGHLPPGASILAAAEESVETPVGAIKNRLDLVAILDAELEIKEDIYNDNTVEVVLPMIKFFSPKADIIWLRAPADEKAIILGESLAGLSERKGLNTAVIGSTDLTHYGSNYGYSPEGKGEGAYRWAKDKNDAEVINLLLNYSLSEAISHAVNKKSACSIGAAAAAARFGELNESPGGKLVDYSNSYDKAPSESFVGYAGIVY